VEKLGELGDKTEKTLSDDDKSLSLYIRGVAEIGAKNYGVGSDYLVKAIAAGPDKESWIVPYSHYYLGSAALADGNLSDCADWITLAKKTKEKFDFDGRQRMFVKKLDGQYHAKLKQKTT